MVVDLSRFPYCDAHLKYCANASEPAMTEYWAAATIASDYSDATLKAFGGFDFDDRSEENGLRLLLRMEKMLSDRAAAKRGQSKPRPYTPTPAHDHASMSLNAFLGSHGVKTSSLMTHADYWAVAKILWPQIREDKGDLRAQIMAIPKKDRAALSKRNRGNLPAKFTAWLSRPKKKHRNSSITA